MQKPQIIAGNTSKDARGAVKFFNDFTFKEVKRFYEVKHTGKIPRAFHGHIKEAKYVYVESGSILFCVVRLDDNVNPSKKNKVKKFILSADDPKILYVPPGYANGFKPLEKNTKVLFFSTATLEQSKNDDFRLPFDYWGKKIWNNN
jgi:dTDP-4-dehydrorhamnose 3,5-epimerase-like enzyme